MKNALYPAGLILAAAALTGCLFGNPSDAPDDLANPGEITRTIPYKVEGNTLVTLGESRTDVYCSGTDLRIETYTLDPDTIPFHLTGSILTFFTDVDTLESGAVTEEVAAYSRQGSGNGLQGLWFNISEDRRLLSGVPTEEETADLERNRIYRIGRRAHIRSWARIAEGKITLYEDREFAKQFISSWNNEFHTEQNADSARYAITANAVDKQTVELKGRKNGETVRITMNYVERTYSSDRPGHALYRYASEPKTCPNEYTPDWYEEFLDANRNPVDPEPGLGLEKTLKSIRKAGPSGIFPSAL